MRRELALQLLQSTVPGIGDEAAVASLFRELQFLAEYKYNKYEMYHPGRLFLESLYLWLQRFSDTDREAAIRFVQEQLIFISRQDFQQLAGVMYHEVIRRRQIEAAAALSGLPSHRTRAILESPEFKLVSRASLYVGMSDGARIDYIRRHNLDIGNEQVLPYYETSETKAQSVLSDLRRAQRDDHAHFKCVFLLDDFCGSGSTLLREVVSTRLPDELAPPAISESLTGTLSYSRDERKLELRYRDELSGADREKIRAIGTGPGYEAVIGGILARNDARDTEIKGALARIASGAIAKILDPNAGVFLCPLLATERAISRLQPLLPRLTGVFGRTLAYPAATIARSVETTTTGTPFGALCEKYYKDVFGDEHTGSVKFGYHGCGLPVVLHHNTPNNSLYLLWARQEEDSDPPLFVRYERHRREET